MVRLGSKGLVALHLDGAILKDSTFTFMFDSKNLVEYTVDQSHPCKIALENQTALSPLYWGEGGLG